MSRIIHDLKIGLDQELEEQLRWLQPNYSEFRILRQSVDARKAHSPHFVYSVELFDPGETVAPKRITVEPIQFFGKPVVIIGAGPAGLFAALRLSERGVPCILIEQGSTTEKRTPAIARYWRYGELNPRNNVGFGEGGAGLFSDGKLITRIKSPHIPYVMQRLVDFGAPAEIEYLSNPHVGSDRIRRVIPKIRHRLLELGCEIRFDTKVLGLLTSGQSVQGVQIESSEPGQSGEVIHSDRVILACGHSAEDFFEHLSEIGVHIEAKSFAVGLRIEHPQKLINDLQYRAASAHPKLGPAIYRLANHDKVKDVGVYSFCMCPGGYVLSAATDASGMVCNGMSNYNRNSPFANAAMVVSVDHKKFGNDVFGGLKYRRRLEANTLALVKRARATREVPAQPLMDFLHGKEGRVLKSSSLSGVVPAPLHELFDREFITSFDGALKKFDSQMRGFISEHAQLHGVESRTSCPIRITRDPETMLSLSHSGLYPCGEGAGYAGGITSAACDGIRIAEAIVDENLNARKLL
jgi:uncharacterized FAD-dependent dehydrogenase